MIPPDIGENSDHPTHLTVELVAAPVALTRESIKDNILDWKMGLFILAKVPRRI